MIKSNAYYNQFAKDFVKETWGKTLNIPVIVNNRGKRLGCFRYRLRPLKQAVQIEYATTRHDNHEDVIDTIKHELCHWYCFTEGLNFDDGDLDFERTLNEVGASSTHFGVNNKARSQFIQQAHMNGEMGVMGHKDFSYKKVDEAVILKEMAENNNILYNKEWFNASNITSPTAVYYNGTFVGHTFKYNNGWMVTKDAGQMTTITYLRTRKDIALELMAEHTGL